MVARAPVAMHVVSVVGVVTVKLLMGMLAVMFVECMGGARGDGVSGAVRGGSEKSAGGSLRQSYGRIPASRQAHCRRVHGPSIGGQWCRE